MCARLHAPRRAESRAQEQPMTVRSSRIYRFRDESIRATEEVNELRISGPNGRCVEDQSAKHIRLARERVRRMPRLPYEVVRDLLHRANCCHCVIDTRSRLELELRSLWMPEFISFCVTLR